MAALSFFVICRVCGDEFDTAGELQHHMETEHPVTDEYLCMYCTELIERDGETWVESDVLPSAVELRKYCDYSPDHLHNPA